MRRFVIPVVILTLFVIAQCGQEAPQETGPAPGQRVRPPASPVVNADGSITFAVLAPESKNVMLTITNVPDTMQMNRDENGIWSLTVGPLEPEIWEYSFLIDTVTCIDTANPWVKDELAPQMSMVEVPSDPPAFYEFRDVPHGSFNTHVFLSPVLGESRKFQVYVPPGYNRGRDAYPVLCLFHGIAGEERGWTTNGRAHLILDNLIADGGAVPMIIVMPNGQYPRTAGFGTDAFARDLFEAIMPIVESEYRVKPGTENRAVAGLSMGGQQALDIGFGNLDRFDWIGAFSPAFLSGETFEENHGEALATANDNVRLVWTAIGEDDGLLSRYNNLPPLLDRYGVKYTSTITSGAHEWDVWRKYLRDFASLLFR